MQIRTTFQQITNEIFPSIERAVQLSIDQKLKIKAAFETIFQEIAESPEEFDFALEHNPKIKESILELEKYEGTPKGHFQKRMMYFLVKKNAQIKLSAFQKNILMNEAILEEDTAVIQTLLCEHDAHTDDPDSVFNLLKTFESYKPCIIRPLQILCQRYPANQEYAKYLADAQFIVNKKNIWNDTLNGFQSVLPTELVSKDVHEALIYFNEIEISTPSYPEIHLVLADLLIQLQKLGHHYHQLTNDPASLMLANVPKDVSYEIELLNYLKPIFELSDPYLKVILNQLVRKYWPFSQFNFPEELNIACLSFAIENKDLLTIRALLEKETKILRPEDLLLVLMKSDPRHRDVIYCFQALCRQYPNKEYQVYLDKLQALEKSVTKKSLEWKSTLNVIRDAIPDMPDVLVDMVASYRETPLSTLSLFSYKEIDTLLKVNDKTLCPSLSS